MLLCPECDTQMRNSEDLRIGRVIVCADCQLPWEVIGQDPTAFKLVELEISLISELVEGDWAD